MTKPKKTNFSPEFRLEATAKAMGVGYSTINKWVKQLREERKEIKPKAMPMTA